MHNVKIKSPHNDAQTVSWTDNNSKEERATNKHLGFFKHYLHTKGCIPLNDIRIRRDKQTVKLHNKKIVVKPGPDGSLIATDEALTVENEVTAAVTQWKRKIDNE